MKRYLNEGDEFANRLNRTKRIVFIEGVYRGINNTHVDNIYHVKDLQTGKITHIRNEWFALNKWIPTNATINIIYGKKN